MNPPGFDRRQLLTLGLAGAAGLGVVGVAARAGAFELQKMGPAMARSYLSACETPALHAQMLAEVDAALAGRPLTAQQVAELRTSARCPICGCPLVAAALPPVPMSGATAPGSPF